MNVVFEEPSTTVELAAQAIGCKQVIAKSLSFFVDFTILRLRQAM